MSQSLHRYNLRSLCRVDVMENPGENNLSASNQEMENITLRELVEEMRLQMASLQEQLASSRGSVVSDQVVVAPQVPEVSQVSVAPMLPVSVAAPSLQAPIISLGKQISQFNGKKTTSEAKEWLERILALKKIYLWNDGTTLEVLKQALEGAALDWYLGVMEETTTLENFLIRFRSMFLGEVSLSEKFERMRKRVQERGEDILDYFHAKVRLCKECKLEFADIKRQVLYGLWSKALVSHLLSTNHTTVEELLQSIRYYSDIHAGHESIAASSKGKPTSDNRPSSSKPTLKPSRIADKSLEVNKEDKKEGDGKEFRCFLCKGLGHAAKDCTDMKCYNCFVKGHTSKNCTAEKRAPFCTGCRTEGHTKRQCTKKEGTDTITQRTMLIEDVASSGEKYMKEVIVGGSKILGFIDQGSANTIIKESIALIITDNLMPTNALLKGYGPKNFLNIVEPIGKFCSSIQVDEAKLDNVEIVVVKDEDQTEDIIIGRTFTDHDSISYYKLDNILRFVLKNNFPFREFSLDPVQYNVITEICAKPNITKEMLTFGEIYNDNEKSQILNVVNEYRDAFAINVSELGCTNLIEMDIVEKPNSVPCKSKPFKTASQKRQIINSTVTEWKDAGFIRDTMSAYSSPVFLVGKKDGDQRLVVDFRKLNDQTLDETFPLPDIDRQLEKLSGCKYFIVLDLMNGFLQVPLKEEACHKTAFVTEDGVYEFTRVMFGLKNAPRVFAKLMNKILGQFENLSIMFFQDDILIAAATAEMSIEYLRLVLKELKRANLTCKVSKCFFGMLRIEYLGFEITANGISPGKRKTKAIAEFSTPTTLRNIRQFLGLTGFFRRFVQNYATKVEPITRLLRKDVQFNWTEEQNIAFKKIIGEITAEPTLQLYNPKARTEVHTDASAIGVGGMLIQYDDHNKPHLVYCVSKKTSPEEKNYHSTKLELLAVVFTVDRLRQFLLGIKFVIVSDCSAVTYLRTNHTRNPQVARWFCLLQEYDFSFKHRPGTKMDHVDALSRMPVEEASSIEDDVTVRCNIMTISTKEDEIVAFQAADPDIQNIIKKLRDKRSSREIKDNYEFVDGILFRKVKDNRSHIKRLFVVPAAMRKGLAVRFHDLAGHFAVERVIEAITKKYWFPRLRRYIKSHIASCLECILRKVPSGKKPGLLSPIPPAKKPFEILNIDHLGPFPCSKKKNTQLFVAVCNLTKFVKIFAVKSVATVHVIRCLNKIFDTYGKPKRVISDRGRAFTSNSFETFCKELNIQHTLISVRHPAANGQVERINRVLIPMIGATVQRPDETDWDISLNKVERDINSATNKSIGMSPYEALFGYLPSFENDNCQEITDRVNNEEWVPPAELRKLVFENIEKTQNEMKSRFDKKRFDGVTYEVGELIFIKKPPDNTGNPTKLQTKYRGPLVVTKVLPGNSYCVQNLDTHKGRSYITNVHVEDMKQWKPNHDELNPSYEKEEQDEEEDK